MEAGTGQVIQVEVVGPSGVSRESFVFPPEEGDRSDKLLRAWHRTIASLRRRQRVLRHLVYAIWSESRTLVPRMKLAKSMRSGNLYLRFGRMDVSRPNEPLQPNARTNACISDTQLLMGKLPWVSAVELHFFLLGWDKGEQFLERKKDSCKSQ
jgi:hypothetical protein